MKAEVFGSVRLAECDKKLKDSVAAYSFTCKCGCEMFTVDIEIYADYSWATVMICAACRKICQPTEPVTNGLH